MAKLDVSEMGSKILILIEGGRQYFEHITQSTMCSYFLVHSHIFGESTL